MLKHMISFLAHVKCSKKPQLIFATRLSSSYTRKDVTIPIPISRGHLAAQLWEGPQNLGSANGMHTPIICMHGVQDNSCSFDPLIPLIIKDNMTIISVDQPGHGFSSPIAGSGYDLLIDGVGTIHRVMRHYNWEKVTLMGHSYGSIISFIFAGVHPEKIDKYIAIENVHSIPRDVIPVSQRLFRKLFEVEEKLSNPKTKQPVYTYQEMFERVKKARKGTVTDEGIKTLLKRGSIPDPQNKDLFRFTHDLKTTVPSGYARFTYDQSLHIAGNIRCPVCAIKGDPGEDYEPRENYMGMVEAMKVATSGKLVFHLVPGTHHLHLNEPQSVAPLISEFLETKF